MKTTILSMDDICTIVSSVGLDSLMDETINVLHAACLTYHSDKFTIPVRQGFDYDKPHTGLLEWMPSMKNEHDVCVKMVGYHPNNPSQYKLPTVLSVGLNFDTNTGHLLGLLDATFLTAIRTGAASAVASRILARSDSRTLGLVGAGAQAISQLHGLSRLFKLQRILVYDTDPSATESFQQRTHILRLKNIDIHSASLEDICSCSDIICTSTSVAVGDGPVLPEIETQPWLHINAVGSDFPGKVEIPHCLLKSSIVCPDFTEQAIREGECQQLDHSEIGPDLSQLVQSEGRYQEYQNQPSVFDSTGWALEDYLLVEI